MRLNIKPVAVVGVALLLFVLFAGVAMFAYFTNKAGANKEKIEVYFLEPLSNTLATETHLIERAEKEDMTDAVLSILYGGPKSKNLAATFPPGVRLIEGKLIAHPDSPEDFTLTLKFSEEYGGMSPPEEQYFRGSLVWSVTELPFIKDVRISVGDSELLKTYGQPLGSLSRGNVIINPVISPDKVDSQKVKLYFYDSAAGRLAAEERTILVNPDHPVERYVMEQIIAGPKTAGLSPVVPPETRLKGDVKTEEGICYINLSVEFDSKNTASGEQLRLNIYAVVNALTELDNVKKVQFSIESEKMENFKGSIDLSTPFERNEEVLFQQVTS